ncbi:carboxy terminal-processing peptidase [Parasegetibacter sp. NRK P23]|uniref:carboxy terminal-processing peptidase n=1 Tax=Parasegetibacter sp. NRK P23 TaxID=2942999 RepID=UPI002043CC2E|nr:carboxy terminal-processing peptidase [Parasegetibacter sp. NRK P23]MCM5528455.1 carboxy terminal-processing peptidase [Parasegetibacter sp. NRK P23]
MFSKKSLPVVALLLVCGLFLAYRSLGTHGAPPTKYERILRNLGEMLSQGHYSPKNINDDFSKVIFKKYLEDLDRDKNIFLASDIQELKKYETKIDDEINGGALQFFPAISAVYQKRMMEVSGIYEGLLAKPFDFSTNETIALDPEKNNYAATPAERTDAWRKKLKYLTLERYADLLDLREKNKGTEGFKVKTDAELETEAREKVKKTIHDMFDRLKNKFTEEERFNLLVNTISSTMDPHTNFFPPVDKRYFDEQMSGRFFGIGAQLQETPEGTIKIISIVAGSPAWKSGELEEGDIIMKVGQGSQEPVDLSGFDITDAVKVIRGAKGTEVKLTVKKKEGSLKVVSLVRDEIVQDEGFARSLVVKEGDKRIGYIFLKDFYADFERADGAKSAVDVGKEIVKLKEANVDGIVMDLRNNGGGSLYDVIQIVGYFIPDGPVVQVKDRDGKPKVLPDRDKSVLYDGPLAVMVNEYSASASEIFAAAIQDYKRGVIIGSTSTYGKGTVQRNIGLDFSSGMLNPNSDLGSVKLTLQKFYRINGGSTQLRGVASDIVIPDVLETAKVREKDNPDALPWDEIAKADYTTWKQPVDVAALKAKSEARVKAHTAFETIRKNGEWLGAKNDEKTASLNLTQYRAQQKMIREKVKEIEGVNKLKTPLELEAHASVMEALSADKNKLENYKKWMKLLSEDIYLEEAVQVMNDMVKK